MSPQCPICDSLDAEIDANEDAYLCVNSDCRAKFIWPQPIPPAPEEDQQ